MRGKRIAWLGDWGGAYPMEPGILAQSEAALRVFEDLGAVVEPLSPPYPAEKLWHAWITLRAMLNTGAKRGLYDDPASRAATKVETIWEIEQGMGLPALALPAGFGANGLPMGMQLIGRNGADAEVLAMGQAYHAATDWPGRRSPDPG